MTKTNGSVLLMAVTISFLASTAFAAAPAPSFTDSWLNFVDRFGITLWWKPIIWYTFWWPISMVYCSLGIDVMINVLILR